MALKPQDILVVLKLVASEGESFSYPELAGQLNMSASEVHAAISRALAAGLVIKTNGRVRAAVGSLAEFLIHGLRYAFPAKRGGLTRGMPTSYAAPPLRDQIVQPAELPPVWPVPDGPERGVEVSPIYRSAPLAAQRDGRLYELLALVDAIRIGRARERKLAERELKVRLKQS